MNYTAIEEVAVNFGFHEKQTLLHNKLSGRVYTRFEFQIGYLPTYILSKLQTHCLDLDLND